MISEDIPQAYCIEDFSAKKWGLWTSLVCIIRDGDDWQKIHDRFFM